MARADRPVLHRSIARDPPKLQRMQVSNLHAGQPCTSVRFSRLKGVSTLCRSQPHRMSIKAICVQIRFRL